MNEFLKDRGFVADPFESTNAEYETRLVEYFVEPPYFASVFGDPSNPASHIVFAPRGSGKTAQRRMIEERSAVSREFLCLTYDRFDQPAGFKVSDADLGYHLNHVCRLMLLGVLFELEQYPNMASTLTKFQRGLLKYEVTRFLGTLSADEYQNAVQSIKTFGDRAGDFWKKYGGPVQLGLSALMAKAGISTASIPSQVPLETKRDDGLSYHFEQLISIIQALGMGSVYVLVDKADEIRLTSADSKAAYALVQSLITDLPTLEHPGICFKFFLWDHVASDYREQGGRPDRIQVNQLRWSAFELSSMLERRLQAFSDGKVQSLNELLFTDIELDLHKLVSLFCQGSPRDMIRSIKAIVDEVTKSSTSSPFISEDDVWEGLTKFAESRALEICPSILPDLRKVQKVNFTIKYVANDILHVESRTAGSKIQKWVASGVVEQIGHVPNPLNQPMHLYGISDLRVAIAALKNPKLSDILSELVSICPHCDDLVISDEITCLCRHCGNPVRPKESQSMLASCTIRTI